MSCIWMITKDNLNDHEVEESLIGTTSGNYYKGAIMPFEFRLLDDDGEVFFHGRSSDCSSEEAFSPLDNFGMPFFGATEIQYFEKGKWETL